MKQTYLAHHGIKGQKWGVLRWRNRDGTLTEAGKKKYAKYGDKKASSIEKDFYDTYASNKGRSKAEKTASHVERAASSTGNLLSKFKVHKVKNDDRDLSNKSNNALRSEIERVKE